MLPPSTLSCSCDKRSEFIFHSLHAVGAAQRGLSNEPIATYRKSAPVQSHSADNKQAATGTIFLGIRYEYARVQTSKLRIWKQFLIMCMSLFSLTAAYSPNLYPTVSVSMSIISFLLDIALNEDLFSFCGTTLLLRWAQALELLGKLEK